MCSRSKVIANSSLESLVFPAKSPCGQLHLKFLLFNFRLDSKKICRPQQAKIWKPCSAGITPGTWHMGP